MFATYYLHEYEAFGLKMAIVLNCIRSHMIGKTTDIDNSTISEKTGIKLSEVNRTVEEMVLRGMLKVDEDLGITEFEDEELYTPVKLDVNKYQKKGTRKKYLFIDKNGKKYNQTRAAFYLYGLYKWKTPKENASSSFPISIAKAFLRKATNDQFLNCAENIMFGNKYLEEKIDYRYRIGFVTFFNEELNLIENDQIEFAFASRYYRSNISNKNNRMLFN